MYLHSFKREIVNKVGKDTIVIREIEPKDNEAMERIIKNCFHELELPLEGTAYSDPETTKMYQSYQKKHEVYYIVEKAGEVLGGAGIKPLRGYGNGVCEIQKMYFSPQIRGKGLGKKLFATCLEAAKQMGYKTCYLESAPQLKAAVHIYERYGFEHLKEALGNTGHYSCGIWMTKKI